MSAEERLAAIIAEEIRGDGWTCDCHEPMEPGECRDCDALHQRTAARAADVITQADRLAVVELPQPSETGQFGRRTWAASFTEDNRRVNDQFDSIMAVSADRDGLVDVEVDAENGLFPDEAERVAVAVLAAARSVETDR